VQGVKRVAANLFDIFFAPTKIFCELRSDVRRIFVSLHVKCPFFSFFLVCESIGTAATPGDSKDDCGEADGM
jgi:hypothetical protein